MMGCGTVRLVQPPLGVIGITLLMAADDEGLPMLEMWTGHQTKAVAASGEMQAICLLVATAALVFSL